MIITIKAPYKLWKGDQEIKTSGLPCVSRLGSSTIIVMRRIADCFRNDYELIINKKNSVKVSQSFLYSLVGGGRGDEDLEPTRKFFSKLQKLWFLMVRGLRLMFDSLTAALPRFRDLLTALASKV